MTFQEQLSAAADDYAPFKTKPAVNICAANEGFHEGARWALQSELIKELEAALKQCHLEMFVTVWKDEQVFSQIEQALQKLSEARGE